MMIVGLAASCIVCGLRIVPSFLTMASGMSTRAMKTAVASSVASLLFSGAFMLPPALGSEEDTSIILGAKEKLSSLKSAEDTTQILDGASALLNSKLDRSLKRVLEEKVPVKTAGRDRHNTVEFHAKSTIDDLVLVKEYYTADSIALSEKAGGEQKVAQLKFAKEAISAAEKEIVAFLEGLEPPQ